MPWYAKLILGTIITAVISGTGFIVGLWVNHVENKLTLVDIHTTQLALHDSTIGQIKENQMETLTQLKEINSKLASHMIGHRK